VSRWVKGTCRPPPAIARTTDGHVALKAWPLCGVGAVRARQNAGRDQGKSIVYRRHPFRRRSVAPLPSSLMRFVEDDGEQVFICLSCFKHTCAAKINLQRRIRSIYSSKRTSCFKSQTRRCPHPRRAYSATSDCLSKFLHLLHQQETTISSKTTVGPPSSACSRRRHFPCQIC
jgi:hypothetical protein